jgi:spore coat protein A
MTFQLNPKTDKWLSNNELRPIAVAEPVHKDQDTVPHYRVQMQAIRHTFHPKLRDIPMWSFGPSSPGVIIETKVGTPARVTWLNQLVGQSLSNLMVFGDRQGMEEDHMLNISHNVVHLHGARVPWTSDGFPEHVFHPNEGRIFYYPNLQAATMLWYHDHAMDVTRLNVYAGLFGLYLIRDPEEATVLPSGDLEVPIVLQDKSFSDDGKKLYYEQSVDRMQTPPEATPEFIGEYPVVNGQIWPVLKLGPRIYRLRLVNGANTRFFNLTLTPDNDPNTKLTFHVIGTDGGFLTRPVPVTTLLLAPGERADLLLDLRTRKDARLILRNDAPIPYSGNPLDPQFQAPDYGPLDPGDNCAQLLKIKVEGHHHDHDARFDPATIQLPPRLDPLPGPPQPSRDTFSAVEAAIAAVPIDVLRADLSVPGISFKLRRFKLEEYQLFMDTLPGIRVPTVQVNGASYDTAPPVVVTKDAVEVWEFVNVTPDTHPMHIHLVQFQVMSRIRLDVVDDPPRQSDDLPEPKNAKAYLNAAPVEEFEKGWKDTVRCDPAQSTRVMARFEGYAGNYVYHCHILEHEDMGMMFRLNVEP